MKQYCLISGLNYANTIKNTSGKRRHYMKYIASRFFILTLWLSLSTITSFAYAQVPGGFDDVFDSTPKFLKVDQAFVFDYQQTDNTLTLSFDIAQGYYLYKKQFKLVAKQAGLADISFPEGVIIEDEYYGKSEVYYDKVTLRVPISHASNDGLVKVRYQGCADAGLCYPPTIKTAYLSAVTGSSQQLVQKDTPAGKSTQYSLADKLINKDNLLLTLALFFALGIGLAFTPCVFPMYPIVSGIVIGQSKQLKTATAFWLIFTYVQGMAITYSLLGLVVASAGVQFQAALQHPIILGGFVGIFILLALAMFGRYELQLPAKWQEKLTNLSNAQTRGNLIGVFVMGAISGLIASPCTTAPLTGILLFIAQSGDTTLGFISLYLLSIGMGVPLILFGITGGKLLPKAGRWMNVVKVTFGFMMLSVAIVFIERLWASDYINLLWATLGLGAFGYYFVQNENSPKSPAKYVRTLAIVAGLFASAYLAYTTLVPSNNTQSVSNTHPAFIHIKNLEHLETEISKANAQGKSVMVDLYADWCVACKEFEKYTFPNEKVVRALNNTVWMQIDLTDTTEPNKAFQDRFNILGLPTILFFDEQGNKLTHARVTGFMEADPFAAHIAEHLNSNR